MIVDDDRDSADSLADLLRDVLSPVQVNCAYNGDQAVEVVCAHHESLDVVITDLEMPNTDGVSVAQSARRALGTRLLLIAMTGNVVLAAQPAVTAVFDHVLVKPLRLEELMALINRFSVLIAEQSP